MLYNNRDMISDRMASHSQSSFATCLWSTMHSNIQKLYEIANKQEIKIIGLNSGTSIDGLDVVLCTFEGAGLSTKVRVLHFATVPFTDDVKSQVRKVFAQRTVDFQHLCVLNPWLGLMYGKIVLDCLESWGIQPHEVDIIASHGQTVFHAPKAFHGLPNFPNGTLQIGDGDHLAVSTGIITISDFRQKHAAAGGEGAPLAVQGEYPIFSKAGQSRILLNIGGIANFTYLPGSLNAEFVFETDTGPGNTLLDAFTLQHFGKSYDDGGKIAATGTVNETLLAELKSDEWFSQSFPKTTGPELFKVSYVTDCQAACGQTDVKPADLLATLTALTAETIALAIEACLATKHQSDGGQLAIFHSGGGSHNTLLMNTIKKLLPSGISFESSAALGIPEDAKEAVLFATMANEALRGGTCKFGKSVPSVAMGKISFPH